jgi:hypothetical protein
MKNKNNTPSHKVKNSKSLLSSTIEYIKNDLKSEYNYDEKSSKQSKKILNKNNKNSNSKKPEKIKVQEQINQKQSKK